MVWVGLRIAMNAAMFLTVAALLGAVPSPWGVLAVPFATLGGLAFALPLAAYLRPRTATCRSPSCSGWWWCRCSSSPAPFPVSRLPDGLEPVARLTPLWHAVELCRGATTGTLGLVEARCTWRCWPRSWRPGRGSGCGPARPGPVTVLALVGTRRVTRVVERNARVNVHVARVRERVLRAGLLPVLHRRRRGAGRPGRGPGGRLVDYEQYVALAMMAVAAMNGCIFDTTFNFGKIKYAHTYDGMLATRSASPTSWWKS